MKVPPKSTHKRFLGISRSSWIVAAISLSLCGFIYEFHAPSTPNALQSQEAQTPNRLRSPWGTEKPL
jgi:hypothetical protein